MLQTGESKCSERRMHGLTHEQNTATIEFKVTVMAAMLSPVCDEAAML